MSSAFTRRAAGVALLGAGVMVAALGYGVLYGDFGGEGSILLDLPWGLATLADVYVGLVLFSAWVAWREPGRWTAGAWIVAILAGGNLVTCCYVLKAVSDAGSDPVVFWTGGRS